jgi:hypothetical protein
MKSSAAIVTARAVGVCVAESAIRSYTRIAMWITMTAFVAWSMLAVLVDSWGRALFGVLAFFTLVFAAWILSLRTFVIHALQRVAGGEHYHRVAPLVAAHVDEIKDVGGSLPVTKVGALQWLWLARRPQRLQERVRDTGDLVLKRVPALVHEVGSVIEDA